MATIPLDKACFLALILETLLYGVFLVLFAATWWCIYQRRPITTNRMQLVTMSLIWVLSTVHLIIDILRANQAFVAMDGGSAEEYYLNLANPLQAAKTAVYVTLTLVGDSFAIFRCYIVWGRKRYITGAPLLLLAGTAVGGYGATVAFSRTARGSQVFLTNLLPWITSFLSLTFCTNVFCTSFLAYRILRIQRQVRGISQGNQATNAVVIVVESAALYSFSILSLLIAYLMDSNAQYTVLDLTSPLIGIAFTAIILRVSLGLSSQDSGESNRTPVGLPRSMSINVTQLVETNLGECSKLGTDSTAYL
ncbi:hypothetical protein B0H14DRAFT_2977575 [Mycena olivaceomarginata]|nr:hypothetical protein B0H14DRAFT_2977575 [Mycena olivaceomarginata]